MSEIWIGGTNLPAPEVFEIRGPRGAGSRCKVWKYAVYHLLGSLVPDRSSTNAHIQFGFAAAVPYSQEAHRSFPRGSFTMLAIGRHHRKYHGSMLAA